MPVKKDFTIFKASADRRVGSKLCVWLVLLSACMLSACSTPALNQARLQFHNGDSTAALETLAEPDAVTSSDRLLYLLEKGLILHDTGDYDGSARELLAAVSYLDEYNYVSLTSEAKTLLANDWAKRYTGEYSERLWVHSYLMMNFLALGRFDSAAVEARRALERIAVHGGALEDDHFTRSLIGLSFEASGLLNDAYIEYKKLAEQLPNDSTLDALLYRLASRLGFADDAHLYKDRLQAVGKFEAATRQTAGGEAIVFVSSGYIPRKISDSLFTDYDERLSFPRYLLPYSDAPRITVEIDGEGCNCSSVASDLGNLVSESLAQRAAKLTVKAVSRVVVKEAIADAIEEKDELTGELVRLLFFALEEADTRSWQTLPRHLSMVRVPLENNNANVTLSIRGADAFQVTPALDDEGNLPQRKSDLQFYQLRIRSESSVSGSPHRPI